MTNVPLLDLGPQNRALEAQFENAFREVLRSNMFIMGPRLEAFEKDCAAFLGVKHALGVSSGTDALQAFATKYRLRVIEDAAQSMGARWKGRSTM